MTACNQVHAPAGRSSFNLLYVILADDTIGQSAAGYGVWCVAADKKKSGEEPIRNKVGAPAPSWPMGVSLRTGAPSGGNMHD